MANYYAFARSNYFRVKDAATFTEWCQRRRLDYWTKEFDGIGLRYAISPAEGEDAEWPHFEIDESTDEAIEIDIAAELPTYLHPEDIAILIQVGWEKLRYLTGDAVGIRADGKRVYLCLDDIYDRAEGLLDDGMVVTEAAY